MGSISFEGVHFAAYSNDHVPMHVHGLYAEVEVIVELRRDATVLLGDRKDAVRPRNGSKAHVRHVLAVAGRHYEELIAPPGETIMTQARLITNDVEIDAALGRAKLLDGEPLAKTAVYVPSLKVIILGLTNGRRLVLPIEDLQGLESATAKQLQNVEILGQGTGINFPDIDVGFYVPALIEGVYGNRRWMSELGKRGGSARTEAKQIASRANGAKGGRPRKVNTTEVAAAGATRSRKVPNIPIPGKVADVAAAKRGGRVTGRRG